MNIIERAIENINANLVNVNLANYTGETADLDVQDSKFSYADYQWEIQAAVEMTMEFKSGRVSRGGWFTLKGDAWDEGNVIHVEDIAADTTVEEAFSKAALRWIANYV